MNRLHHHRRKAGSALILVFWCLLLLSLAVFAVVEIVELSVEHAAHEQSALQAQTAAASGIAVAEEPQLKRDDPVLTQQISPGDGFKVAIASEGARLNLNYLLLTDHRDVLVSLFTRWGMKIDAAQHAAACLYDWVTPGDLPTLDGAKADAYERAGLPQRPSHQAFTSWDEVALVMGVDAVAAAKPDWQDSFTLWSDGPLDVTQAPAELIAALAGVETGRVEPLVQMRDGRDGIPGTADDVSCNAGALQGELGLTDLQMKALQNQFAFGSTVRRIESAGYAGGVRVKISAVTRITASPQLLVWSER
jgi:type II secretory pathway component PulK